GRPSFVFGRSAATALRCDATGLVCSRAGRGEVAGAGPLVHAPPAPVPFGTSPRPTKTPQAAPLASHVVATLLLPPDVTSLAVLARSVSTLVASTRLLAVTSAPTFGAEAGAAVSRVGPGDAGALPL